ncbi:MAG: pyridoxamine 5'-phosphate oxidase family protein [Chloroflexi bacterium]|nr:pyridoxamine 5'-phosphate oxidase family protein [Chloroflexota bacterium]MBT4072493.1 pyridoxamine 5'-phosphate oxidase family protein [Chloroflexota bacterium]MBT4513947.1 pyridoxamine 5'-phosphate oxidase family protein [Chloroflexota bacterium]MBT5320427.1 pyridoxamine 5'-phosphate oxidase family protein [Chloroflexota bacterium]MBT6681647.1 pyridoxamine 5'-phosphate oxidase family protein [Chloroflexota bacterium]
MSGEAKTDRIKVRRIPERGIYDQNVINEILDAGYMCHVGFNVDHGPMVLPTLYGRDGNTLYIHGSPAAGMMRAMRGEIPACVTVMHVDGIVLARSLFHHSMNYRSVVVFGVPEEVVDVSEKMRALEVVTENVVPGRWDDARKPNTSEFTQTIVLKFSLDEASAKVRTGPPGDDEEDYAMDVWAGVLPVTQVTGALEADPRLSDGITIPGYLSDMASGS